MEFVLEKEAALLEAIFYLETEPLDENSLARISGLSKDMIEKALEQLKEHYSSEQSGIELLQISGGAKVMDMFSWGRVLSKISLAAAWTIRSSLQSSR